MAIFLGIVIAFLLLGLVAACAWLFHGVRDADKRIEQAAGRIRVVAAIRDDADELSRGRARFRRRQQTVENAVALGTSGLEIAHRTLASRLGSSADGKSFYGAVRRLNTEIGRSVSGLLAPRARRQQESLEHWKTRRPDDTPRIGHEPAEPDQPVIEHRRNDD